MKAARVVIFEGEDDYPESKLLLWSPNSSTRLPFFPGRRSLGELKPPPHPFCDGHLGPFNPIRSPQYFDPKHPFWPFLRRCETGAFPIEEEECVPAWATWESSKLLGSVQGYVFQAYWQALRDRTRILRAEGAKLLKTPSCRLWKGFIESYPKYPQDQDFHDDPGLRCFQEFVQIITSLQHDIRWLSAWVRMGQALTKQRFDEQMRITNASLANTQDGMMGVWANGIDESKVAWFAACGIPMFIVHEIQGDKDRPDNYHTLTKVNHPLKGSDLVDAAVLERWLKLCDGRLVEGYWDTGLGEVAAKDKDMLRHWRSSPTASNHNFPGDSWYADSPASPSNNNQIPNSSFVEIPQAKKEWKGLSMGVAHGAEYLIPPPVKGKSDGKWEHFAEDRTDDGTSAFFLVGRRNQDLCSGMNYIFYDRSLRRVFHCKGPLPIPKVVVHNTSIYGFPCPKVHFFQDNSLSRKLHASLWLYTTKEAIPTDVGRSAPSPSLERMSHLIPVATDLDTPRDNDHNWTEDPAPVMTSIPPLEQVDSPIPTPPLPETQSLHDSTIETEDSSQIQGVTMLVETRSIDESRNGQPLDEEEMEQIMTPLTPVTPSSISDEVSGIMENDDPPPPSPNTDSSTSLEQSTTSSEVSAASGKRQLEDRLGDVQTVKRRRANTIVKRKPGSPAFRLTPSRIPGEPPTYSQVTPYLCVKGIGRHSIEDVRGWLAMIVPNLQITVVIKIENHAGGNLFVLKFYTKPEAVSFKCCYNLWTSQEGDTWAIDYIPHKDVLLIPRDRILGEWRLRPEGHLHPLLDCEDKPILGRQTSLIKRLDVSLEDRLRDSQDTEQEPAPSTSGARKRRGGQSRKTAQGIEGKPS